MEEAAKSSGNAVEQIGRQNDAYTQNSLSKEVEAGTKEMEAATEAAVNMLAWFVQVSSMSLITPEQYDERARLRDGVKEGTVWPKTPSNPCSLWRTLTTTFRKLLTQSARSSIA